ncbi:MAG: methylated-DNA--[protein]-cysteine S-methyltransferase [Thermoplasmata archaeon]|nr:methylated-DNA--[protein]-cysteine S-methyltransferase [Thermoplasmata archaeon]
MARRSSSLSDRFVFGVRSTGVYCRSDCPARRPAPRQIVFFDSPRGAVAAGFRPCKRCHPEGGLAYSAPLEAVEKACRRLEGSPQRPWSLPSLAAEVGYSSAHLQRTFRRLLGVSPSEYLQAVRAGRFRSELRAGRSVRAATYLAGHRSLSWPYTGAGPRIGMAAGEFRRGGGGWRVGYAIVPSPLGLLLVAATPLGICLVEFGQSEDALTGRLRSEFPQAEVRPDPSLALRGWAERMVRSIDGGGSSIAELPLDVRATAFQARVWHAVRSIARGHTTTYSDIARELGSPGAARAVARACAANPAALLIPCQRVVPAAGGVGGYRWGARRKRRLLAAERGPARPVL